MRISLFIIFSFIAFVASAQDGEKCGSSENKKALKYYSSALEEYNKKNPTAALPLIEKAIVEDDVFLDPLLLKAQIAEEIKKNKMLIEALEAIIKLCPEANAEAYFKTGSFYFKNIDYKAATERLNIYLQKGKDEEHLRLAKTMNEIASFRLHAVENPVPFAPQPLAEICTQEDEYLPIISPDDEVAFFTRRFSKQTKNSAYSQQLTEEFTSSERKNGVFEKGNKMSPPFNTNNNEGGATVTIDNNDLYFTICKDENGRINCDIYHSHFANGKWSSIQNMGPEVNDPLQWDSQPSISADGNTLYFASGRDGGFGGYDIYKTEKDASGNWQKPENLGPQINTAGNEKSPFIHTDSNTLYFSSDSLVGMGDYDIFYSKKRPEGWEKPTNIGYPINSESADLGFFVSTDGKTGYFASNKLAEGKGGWDIYSFFLYPAARPDKVLFVKGTLLDEKTGKPVNGSVELKGLRSNKTMRFNVDSTTGKYAAAIRVEDEDYALNVKKKGFVPSAKVISKDDPAFDKPAKVDLSIKPIEAGMSFVIKDVHFANNSYELDEKSKQILGTVIDFLNENLTVKMSINGHTDNVSGSESNKILSLNRARAVYNYLIESGIDKNRLSFYGYGEEKPIASNETEEGKALNRRTEFIILSK